MFPKLKNLTASIGVGALIMTTAPARIATVIPNANAQSIKTFPGTLDEWLDALQYRESHLQCPHGYECTEKRFRRIDSNDKYSYSCLQFQRETWDTYAPRYFGDLDPEAIYDCGRQRAVAKAMILENPENWRHWFNSVTDPSRGIGLPPLR